MPDADTRFNSGPDTARSKQLESAAQKAVSKVKPDSVKRAEHMYQHGELQTELEWNYKRQTALYEKASYGGKGNLIKSILRDFWHSLRARYNRVEL